MVDDEDDFKFLNTGKGDLEDINTYIEKAVADVGLPLEFAESLYQIEQDYKINKKQMIQAKIYFITYGLKDMWMKQRLITGATSELRFDIYNLTKDLGEENEIN